MLVSLPPPTCQTRIHQGGVMDRDDALKALIERHPELDAEELESVFWACGESADDLTGSP